MRRHLQARHQSRQVFPLVEQRAVAAHDRAGGGQRRGVREPAELLAQPAPLRLAGHRARGGRVFGLEPIAQREPVDQRGALGLDAPAGHGPDVAELDAVHQLLGRYGHQRPAELRATREERTRDRVIRVAVQQQHELRLELGGRRRDDHGVVFGSARSTCRKILASSRGDVGGPHCPATVNKRSSSAIESASCNGLSSRIRSMRGKRTAMPLLCRALRLMPSKPSSNTRLGLTLRTGPNFSSVVDRMMRSTTLNSSSVRPEYALAKATSWSAPSPAARAGRSPRSPPSASAASTGRRFQTAKV
jgi:hypothetical protein